VFNDVSEIKGRNVCPGSMSFKMLFNAAVVCWCWLLMTLVCQVIIGEWKQNHETISPFFDIHAHTFQSFSLIEFSMTRFLKLDDSETSLMDTIIYLLHNDIAILINNQFIVWFSGGAKFLIGFMLNNACICKPRGMSH